MKHIPTLILLAIGAAAGMADGAESVDAVTKKLEAASAKVSSVSCMQRETTDARLPNNEGTHSEASGALEYERSGGKPKWREESKGFQVQKSAGQESRMDFDTVKFDDGDRTWLVMNSGGKATVFKLQFRETRPILADKSLFDALRADNTLELKPEEKVDGASCIVLDATPTMFAGKVKSGQAATRYWILPDSGIIVKIVTHDMQAQPIVTTARSGIKTGKAIPAERFKPPPGAEIKD